MIDFDLTARKSTKKGFCEDQDFTAEDILGRVEMSNGGRVFVIDPASG
jgi:hypothetical protein